MLFAQQVVIESNSNTHTQPNQAPKTKTLNRCVYVLYHLTFMFLYAVLYECHNMNDRIADRTARSHCVPIGCLLTTTCPFCSDKTTYSWFRALSRLTED